MKDIEIVIPEEETEIKANTFKDRTDITSVVIHENVEWISSDAFKGCTSLKHVTILGNNIEQCYDFNCPSITKATLSLTAWNHISKKMKKNLLEVEIIVPDSITVLESKMFKKCTALKKITLPDTLKVIGMQAFMECSNLEEINIPDSVRIIGEEAFINCSSLKKIKLSNNLKVIEHRVFEKCSTLAEISIPYSVSIIQEFAFAQCSSLLEVNITNPNLEIHQNAFSGESLSKNSKEIITRLGGRFPDPKEVARHLELHEFLNRNTKK